MSVAEAKANGLLRYGELSQEAKQAACDWWRNSYQWDCFDTDDITEMLEESLAEDHGLRGMKVYWSLASCQGDGVAFEGNPDLDEWAAHDSGLREILDHITVWVALTNCGELEIVADIKHEGNYTHCHSMNAGVEVRIYDYYYLTHQVLEELECELRDYLNEAVVEISRKLEDMGYKKIDYHRSDEYIGETLEANDYEFCKHGKRDGEDCWECEEELLECEEEADEE